MNIKKNTRKKRTIVISAAFAVVISALVFAYYLSADKNNTTELGGIDNVKSSQQNSSDHTEDSSGNSINDISADIKKDFVNSKYEDDVGGNSQPDKASINFTSISQSSDYLSVRAIIDPSSGGTGVCRLTLSKGNSISITKEAGVEDLGAYSSCKGFDIPMNEFKGVYGDWDVKVDYLTGSKEVASAVKEVTINEY